MVVDRVCATRGTGATAASVPEAPDRFGGESSNKRNLHVHAHSEGSIVVQGVARSERGRGCLTNIVTMEL